MAGLKIAYKQPRQLKPRPRNPRTYTAKQIKQIAASIERFGSV
jgi:ParB-like chromosome segregation protein Spo0J